MMEVESRSTCNNCKHAHKACSKTGPPCSRCEEQGLQDTCAYVSSTNNNAVILEPIIPESKQVLETPIKKKKKKKNGLTSPRSRRPVISFQNLFNQSPHVDLFFYGKDGILLEPLQTPEDGHHPLPQRIDTRMLVVGFDEDPERISTIESETEVYFILLPVLNFFS